MKATVLVNSPILGIGIIVLCLVTLPLEARRSKKTDNEEGEVQAQGSGTKEKASSASRNDYDDYPTVKLGSFNLKQFGKKKADNEEVLKIISNIVMRYDLIALQEITDVKENAIKKLISSVNQESMNPYHYVISPRVGRNKQKEQYALMYRPDIFQVKRHTVYDDSEGDPFSREPQVAEVVLKPNGEKFGIINMHVAPRNASAEINSLAEVHTWVKTKWRLKNVIIIGDLNADCDYIRKKDIPSISLLNNSKYRWLITDDFDTTVGNTNCAYDRIIVSGSYLAKNVVAGSAGVFEFDKVYQLEKKFALNVSDHYPVEVSMFVETAPVDRVMERVQSSAKTSLSEIGMNLHGMFMALCSVIMFLY